MMDPHGTCPACHLRRDPSCSGPVCKILKATILAVPGQQVLPVPAAGPLSSQSSTFRPPPLPVPERLDAAGLPMFHDIRTERQSDIMERHAAEQAALRATNESMQFTIHSLRATIASMQKAIETSTQAIITAENKAGRTMDDLRTRIQHEEATSAELRNIIASMQEKIDTFTQHVETTRTQADELKEIASGPRSSSGSDSDNFQLVQSSQQEIQEAHKEMLVRIKALEDASAEP